MSRAARVTLDRGTMPSSVYALLALLAYDLPAACELSALRHSRDIVWG